MKIISPFKDYYDFVGHSLYSGGDEKVVYLRGKIKEQSIKSGNDTIWIPHSRRTKTHTVYFEWLVVCGRVYLLISYRSLYFGDIDYKILSKEEYDTLLKDSYFYKATYEMYVGSESPASISLSKEINQPVFIIDSTESVISGKNKGCYSKINPDVPSLEKLGFSKIQDPYSLYQDIYQFISNVLRENPDVKPPVEVSNKNKIIAGGFNLKQSFRHRK